MVRAHGASPRKSKTVGVKEDHVMKMPWHNSFVLSGIEATEHLFDNWSDTIERDLPDRMCKFASRTRAALAGSPEYKPPAPDVFVAALRRLAPPATLA